MHYLWGAITHFPLPSHSKGGSMKIEHLMVKNPITVTEDASISTAIELMKANSIRHLPVVAKDHVLIGFLTLADLKQGMIPYMLGDLTMKDLMIKDPITVRDQLNSSLEFSFISTM